MKSSMLGLFLLLSVEAKTFDEIPEPCSYEGFTVTVEYSPSSSKMEIVREFYEDIINERPNLVYFKTSKTSWPWYKLPAVTVRCNGKDVYHSYGVTPPRFVWNKAIDYFVNVLDREKNKCK